MKLTRILRYGLVALAPLWGAPQSQASSTGNAPITSLIVVDGKVFFNLDTSRTTAPTCATPTPNRWVFNASTADGQAMLASLLTLKALGKQVNVIGTGTCPDWFDTETVQQLLES
jgi:hypothetical protein